MAVYQLQRKLPVQIGGLTAEMRVDEFRIERTLTELLWEQDPAGSPNRIPRVTGEHSILEVSVPCWVGDKGFHPVAQWFAEGAFTGGSPVPYGLIHFAEGDVKVMVKTAMTDQTPPNPSFAETWRERLKLALLLLMVAGDDVASDDAQWDVDASGLPKVCVVRPKPGLPGVELAAAVTQRLGPAAGA